MAGSAAEASAAEAKAKSYEQQARDVFGKVTDGMEVVRKIAKEPTTTRGYHRDVPTTPILIESARQLPEKATK